MVSKLLGVGLLLAALIGVIYPGQIMLFAADSNDPAAITPVNVDPRPLAVKIASDWPAASVATKPRIVCRQGLCAARQGRVIAVAANAVAAQRKLQQRSGRRG